MPKVEHKVVIEQPANVIFAVLSNVEQLPTRLPSVKDVEVLSDGEFGVGTQFLVSHNMRGREAKIVNEVSQFEEGRVIGFRTISGAKPYEEVYSLEETDEGTEVTLSASGEMPGLMKLFSRSFKRLLNKQIKNDLERLEDLFEEGE